MHQDWVRGKKAGMEGEMKKKKKKMVERQSWHIVNIRRILLIFVVYFLFKNIESNFL